MKYFLIAIVTSLALTGFLQSCNVLGQKVAAAQVCEGCE